jgi:hypothetical protein
MIKAKRRIGTFRVSGRLVIGTGTGDHERDQPLGVGERTVVAMMP